MNQTLINLLPFIFGSEIVPVQIIIILLLLKDQQSGLQKALVFLAGMSTVRLL